MSIGDYFLSKKRRKTNDQWVYPAGVGIFYIPLLHNWYIDIATVLRPTRNGQSRRLSLPPTDSNQLFISVATSLFIIHYSLFIIHYSSFIIHHFPAPPYGLCPRFASLLYIMEPWKTRGQVRKNASALKILSCIYRIK